MAKKINRHKLAKKLEKKIQEIIEDVECEGCGNQISYVLVDTSTVHEYSKVYREVEVDRITVFDQKGIVFKGYPTHNCKEDDGEEKRS